MYKEMGVNINFSYPDRLVSEKNKNVSLAHMECENMYAYFYNIDLIVLTHFYQ